MKTNYSFSIPKPCHEDWSKMSPNEKGRFCQLCPKTVVDFTQMPKEVIENYLIRQGNKKVCGRFKVSQLEQIQIEIPHQVFQQQTSFNKLFLLVLLVTMGSTLLNCSDQNGNTKKIDTVEVLSTLQAKTIKNPEITASKIVIDTTKTITIPKPLDVIKRVEAPTPTLTGLIVEVMGDIAPVKRIADDEDRVFEYILVEHVPEFIGTANTLSNSEKRAYFSKKISDFVKDNFDLNQGQLTLKGKQSIQTQFIVDKQGKISDVKIEASHPQLEKEALRVINSLPQFIPGKQRGNNVSVAYTLPITIMLED
ncbi:energy transducer TonB [Winogradskyella bathintestinalis]|uniref:Energy transducer TonB n=1 Tax=Winogradskyella bathintestinalis TaxID=3035208 RepID=A0ABT7ZSY9_9FLAO|nr:energy transducer TonB [Winogradskyella bathintestinalis]MDN3491934.1 energy transducer TonB [Winogradskyella bathintestinalis]